MADGPDHTAVLAGIEAELAAVEHALERLDDGSYGTCEICGSALGDDRLEAAPAERQCGGHGRAAAIDKV